MDDIPDAVNMSLSKLREIVTGREACHCSPQGRKELDTTERLNNNQLINRRVL